MSLRTMLLPATVWLSMWFPAVAEETPPAVADILLGGEQGAIRIRLQLVLDGVAADENFQTSHDRYVGQLFRHLDGNGDNRLDRQEAAKSPAPQMVVANTGNGGAASAVNVAFNFAALDADGDGVVGEPELAAYYRDLSDGSFRIHRRPRNSVRSTSSDSLFRRLDINRDRELSVAELAAAPSLMTLDVNANEVLTAAEIALPADLGGGENVARVGRRSLRTTGIGMVSADRTVVGAMEADLTLRLEIQAGKMPVFTRATLREAGSAKGIAARIGDDGSDVVLRVADNWIRLRAAPGPLRAADHAAGVLLGEFQAADADRDGNVGRSQRMPANLRRLFPLIDRDDNRSISADEMARYNRRLLPLQAAVAASRVALAVSDKGEGLFGLLDLNQDGRLGLRELRGAKQIGPALDGDGDGFLDADEIPWSYHLVFRRAAYSLPAEQRDSRGAGPRWFQRMDRNGDGDVSRREFLGDRAAFDRLDVDRDGLVGLVEAVRSSR